MMGGMENRLAMIGLGEVGYYIMVGAYSAGASPSEAFDCLTAFYVAGIMTNRSDPGEEDEETSTQ
jgi:hypothetical protein